MSNFSNKAILVSLRGGNAFVINGDEIDKVMS